MPAHRQFQFHSGSIKSRRGQVNRPGAPMFQFHSGSIKRKAPRGRIDTSSVSIP